MEFTSTPPTCFHGLDCGKPYAYCGFLFWYSGIRFLKNCNEKLLSVNSIEGGSSPCVRQSFLSKWTPSVIRNVLLCSLNTGLFEMIVGVLTTCHTQYT